MTEALLKLKEAVDRVGSTISGEGRWRTTGEQPVGQSGTPSPLMPTWSPSPNPRRSYPRGTNYHMSRNLHGLKAQTYDKRSAKLMIRPGLQSPPTNCNRSREMPIVRGCSHGCWLSIRALSNQSAQRPGECEVFVFTPLYGPQYNLCTRVARNASWKTVEHRKDPWLHAIRKEKKKSSNKLCEA